MLFRKQFTSGRYRSYSIDRRYQGPGLYCIPGEILRLYELCINRGGILWMHVTDYNCFKYVKLFSFYIVNDCCGIKLWTLFYKYPSWNLQSNPRLDISKLPFFCWHSSNVIMKIIKIIVPHLTCLVERAVLNV